MGFRDPSECFFGVAESTKKKYRRGFRRNPANIKKRKVRFGCADSDGEIPDPIPNSEVKPVCGNGTALLSVEE